MSNQVENHLKKLFGAFGRRPLRQQFDVYMEWADKYSAGVVEEVVVHSINNEEKLPTITKLRTLAKSLSPEINNFSMNGIDACWFCADTGFIPYLYEPNDTTSVWHIRMMGCSCSIGQQISGVTNYFDGQEKLQFEDEAKQHPSMNYLEVVDHIKNKRNKELKQIAITDCKLKSAIKEENT